MVQKKRYKKETALQDQKAPANPPGEGKMSSMVTSLIEPYRGTAVDRASYHNLVAIACIAWNTANLPEEAWPANIREAIHELPNVVDEMRPEMARFILELVKQKVALFPDERRIIVDFKITETKDNYYLGIASIRSGEKDEG